MGYSTALALFEHENSSKKNPISLIMLRIFTFPGIYKSANFYPYRHASHYLTLHFTKNSHYCLVTNMRA